MALTIAIAALVVVPSSALGATVSKTGATLTFEDTSGGGEANNLTITFLSASNEYSFKDTGGTPPIGVPADCTTTAADTVECTAVGVTSIVVNAGLGNDVLQGSNHIGETFNGEGGTDEVSYSLRTTGVTADIDGVVGDDGNSDDGAPGSRDTIATDVENLTGGILDDTLTGSTAVNVLAGGNGGDTLNGGDGNDDLRGGPGEDELNGQADNDALSGGFGADTLSGGTNGAAGDTATYAGEGRATGVQADLDGAASDDGSSDDGSVGARDTIVGDVENLTGTTVDDTLTGDGNANTLTGEGGGDTLNGGGDVDTLNGDTGAGTAGMDILNGNGGGDTLNGGDQDDSLDGGLGADGLNGGNQTDTVSYLEGVRTTGVTADLGGAAGGDGSTDDGVMGARDTIGADVEKLTGSTFGDILSDTSATTTANTLSGDAGDDQLTATSGDDTLNGGNGDDTLKGGLGRDIFNGNGHGAVGDTASYDDAGRSASAANAVVADLDAETGDDGSPEDVSGARDTIATDVENLTGGPAPDTLTGNASTNVLDGGAENDVIAGGLGADTINGGADAGAGDTATYAEADRTTGITSADPDGVAGDDGSAEDGAGDTIAADVENLRGSAFADSLSGNGSTDPNNLLEGEDGNDTLQGRVGIDTLDGGDDSDTASYQNVPGPGGVTADLATSTTDDGEGSTDSFAAVENLTGSEFMDTLSGDGFGNTLNGRGLVDVLNGSGGSDFLNGGGGTDTLNGGTSGDTLAGGLGGDTINGGGSADTASYSATDGSDGTRTTGVTADLDGAANDDGSADDGGMGAQDTIASDVENLTGSSFGDNLTGNDGGSNTLSGQGGDDTLKGGLAADTFNGGDGTGDTVSYAEGSRTLGVTADIGGTAGNDGSSEDGDTGMGTADTVNTDVENLTGTDFNDTLTGDSNANTLVGGLGNDTLNGADGDDFLNARDGVADTTSVNCGNGTDTATADGPTGSPPVDTVNADCEKVDYPGTPQTTLGSGPTNPTADNTPTFNFSSNEPGSTFVCRVDMAVVACTGNGTHTAAPLSDGPHTFDVAATDAVAGNDMGPDTDATPASQTFTVDTTPPNTVITGGPTGTTNDNTPTFTFTSTEMGSTFMCRVDTDPFGACSGAGTHTTGTLPDGSHNFEVKATDGLGNADATPAIQTFTVNTAPAATPTPTPTPVVPTPPAKTGKRAAALKKCKKKKTKSARTACRKRAQKLPV